MIIFLGPNRSTETKISKNRCFHGDKRFWSTFPGIIECDQPQGTFCNGQKVCWQLIWKLKVISVTPETLLKTQTFEKRKSNLSGEKFFLAFSFRNHRVGQTSTNSLERSAKRFDTYCASYNVTSVGPQMSLETNISKKGKLPGEKRFWPTCSRIVEFYKPWGTKCKGTQGILTSIVQMIKSFFET